MTDYREKHKTGGQKKGSRRRATRSAKLRQIFQMKHTKFRNRNCQDTNHWPFTSMAKRIPRKKAVTSLDGS